MPGGITALGPGLRTRTARRAALVLAQFPGAIHRFRKFDLARLASPIANAATLIVG